MSLKTYAKKRDVKKSGEPKPKQAASPGKERLFVVQKHDASHLHYDFRLEYQGVLKSWAIPKGPSLNPSDKRLAIRVEDHPYAYHSFEGVIPKGHYGAGTVEIWDEGTYTVEGSMSAGLEKGHLDFTLKGKKLHGGFSLIKLHQKENQWLLIKKKDESASIQEITRETSDTHPKKPKKLDELFKGAKRGTMPEKVHPMLATLVDAPFDREQWLFEIKWDGYRALAQVNHHDVLLYSRNFNSFNDQFADVVKKLKEMKTHVLLDGELVVLNAKGLPDFQLMQNYKSHQGSLVYYVFDILYYQGYDLRSLPLIQRKEILQQVIPFNEVIRFSDHIEEKGKAFFKEVSKKNLEGMMAKNGESPYQMRRSKDWLKVKTHLRQELVIGGFTQPRGSRQKFGSLLLGYYEKGNLIYAGHVGTGFTEKSLREIYRQMEPFWQKESPFKNPPHPHTPVTWLKPLLVCEVSFSEWTKEGIMRHPSFEGMRLDKKQKQVRKEMPTALPVKEKKTHPYASKGKFVPTHVEKVFWEKEGYTKGDVIAYYEKIAPYILPYLKNRPFVMHRFPNGISGESFFQKDADHSVPDWVKTVEVEHEDKIIHYIMVQDKPSLLYVANLGCIEMHPFNSTIDHLDEPTYLVVDLDPGSIGFDSVVETALSIHHLLDECKIKNFCKTSGKRGLHIYVPVASKYDYEQIKEFSRLIVTIINQRLPNITSLARTPAKRTKLIYLDFLQNHRGVTMASPYSLRPVEGAQVSTPLLWEEVRPGLDVKAFNIKTIPKRLEKMGDLFAPVLKTGADLEKALKNLERALS